MKFWVHFVANIGKLVDEIIRRNVTSKMRVFILTRYQSFYDRNLDDIGPWLPASGRCWPSSRALWHAMHTHILYLHRYTAKAHSFFTAYMWCVVYMYVPACILSKWTAKSLCVCATGPLPWLHMSVNVPQIMPTIRQFVKQFALANSKEHLKTLHYRALYY